MNPSCKSRPLVLKKDLFIINQREIAPRIFEMTLPGEVVLDMALGQFLHLRAPDPGKLLCHPISICQIDKVNKVATTVYHVERAGTTILSQMRAGDRVDTVRPQGNGFDLSMVTSDQKALLIDGRIGVPPLVETAKRLTVRGVDVISVLGFASEEAVIPEEGLSAHGKVYVTADDGSYGIKGYVSTVVDDLM